jgi:hypothetical protein
MDKNKQHQNNSFLSEYIYAILIDNKAVAILFRVVQIAEH